MVPSGLVPRTRGIPQCAAAVLLASVLGSFGVAQGTGAYFNVESPQVRPITVARVGTADYLLVCNTPDNSVEIYGPLTSVAVSPPFVARVQTGAEPVSVVWNSALLRFYTANFLGDSITAVSLSGSPLQVTLLRTELVGDEPMHIAFAPDNLSLFVTLGSQSAMARLDSTTLAPVALGQERIDLTDSFNVPTKAIKDPRTVLMLGGRLYVLGHHGGKATTVTQVQYDFDLWSQDFAVVPTIRALGGLGTTNFNMAFAGNGDLYRPSGYVEPTDLADRGRSRAAVGIHAVVGWPARQERGGHIEWPLHD